MCKYKKLLPHVYQRSPAGICPSLTEFFFVIPGSPFSVKYLRRDKRHNQDILSYTVLLVTSVKSSLLPLYLPSPLSVYIKMSSGGSFLSVVEKELLEEFDAPQTGPSPHHLYVASIRGRNYLLKISTPTHRTVLASSPSIPTVAPTPVHQAVSKSAQTEEPLYYHSPLVDPFEDSFRSIQQHQSTEPPRIPVERGVYR